MTIDTYTFFYLKPKKIFKSCWMPAAIYLLEFWHIVLNAAPLWIYLTSIKVIWFANMHKLFDLINIMSYDSLLVHNTPIPTDNLPNSFRFKSTVYHLLHIIHNISLFLLYSLFFSLIHDAQTTDDVTLLVVANNQSMDVQAMCVGSTGCCLLLSLLVSVSVRECVSSVLRTALKMLLFHFVDFGGEHAKKTSSHRHGSTEKYTPIVFRKPYSWPDAAAVKMKYDAIGAQRQQLEKKTNRLNMYTKMSHICYLRLSHRKKRKNKNQIKIYQQTTKARVSAVPKCTHICVWK